MLDEAAQLVVAALMLAGVVGLFARRLDQFIDVRLQRADGAGRIIDPLLEIRDLLPGAVFVQRAGLRALLALLADLFETKSVLGGAAFILLDGLLDAHLTTGELAQRLTQLVNRVLKGRKAGFVSPALIFLTIGRHAGGGAWHSTAHGSRCVSCVMRPGVGSGRRLLIAGGCASIITGGGVTIERIEHRNHATPQSIRVITAFEHRCDPVVARFGRPVDDTPRQVGEALIGDQHTAEGIVFVRVEPGRDQDQLGAKRPDREMEDLVHDLQIRLVALPHW
jgi:hypothetical protein